jgi:hypothetical protein
MRAPYKSVGLPGPSPDIREAEGYHLQNILTGSGLINEIQKTTNDLREHDPGDNEKKNVLRGEDERHHLRATSLRKQLLRIHWVISESFNLTGCPQGVVSQRPVSHRPGQRADASEASSHINEGTFRPHIGRTSAVTERGGAPPPATPQWWRLRDARGGIPPPALKP